MIEEDSKGTKFINPEMQRFMAELDIKEGKTTLIGLTPPMMRTFKMHCSVCLDHADDDKMLSCDKCSISVHEKCYFGNKSMGLENYKFICESCKLMDEKAGSSECFLCGCKEGLLVFREICDEKRWLHIECVKWSNIMQFTDNMLEIKGSKSSIKSSITRQNKLNAVCSLCSNSKGIKLKVNLVSSVQIIAVKRSIIFNAF